MASFRFTGLRVLAAAALASIACVVQAAPVTITFDALISPDGPQKITLPKPYAFGGYTISYALSTPQVFGGNYTIPPGSLSFYNGNGTAILSLCGDQNDSCDEVTVLTLSHGGTAFSLLGLDLANLYFETFRGTPTPNYSGDAIKLVGTQFGGGTVSATLDLTSPFWRTENLIDFTNLQSVTISADGASLVVIDNLRLDDPTGTAVPEPMSLGLAGIALAALVVTRRQRLVQGR